MIPPPQLFISVYTYLFYTVYVLLIFNWLNGGRNGYTEVPFMTLRKLENGLQGWWFRENYCAEQGLTLISNIVALRYSHIRRLQKTEADCQNVHGLSMCCSQTY